MSKKDITISIKVTQELAERIEEIAEEKEWTISKTAAKLIETKINEDEARENREARKLFEYIMEQNPTMKELTEYALETGLYETLKRGQTVFKSLVKERE